MLKRTDTSSLEGSEIVYEKASDNCKCACSQDACSAITTMLSRSISCLDELSRIKAVWSFVQWLVALLDITCDVWTHLSASIICFMTFEKLQLTHTCCTWGMSYFAVFDDTDSIEIQEEQSADLERLSQLMSEFREAFMRFRVPLTDFILGYWKLRMGQVMRGGQVVDEFEIQQLCDIGVIWKTR